MHSNIFYVGYSGRIGGVETFLITLSKLFKEVDILFLYDEERVRPKLIYELSKNHQVEKYIKGKKYECVNAFFNYQIDAIDDIVAKNYTEIIHANFINQALTFPPAIHDKLSYMAVSKENAKAFTKRTGYECGVIYNPIIVEKPKKVIKLLTLSRLSAEKGFKRMIALEQALTNKGINHKWTVCTSSKVEFDSPNVWLTEPKNSTDYLEDCDYLVQLSDTEGLCYSVYEALCHHKPVIITPIPSFQELKVNKDNSIVLNFDLSNIDEVCEEIKKPHIFDYKPLPNEWGKLLDTNYKKGKVKPMQLIKVKATDKCLKTATKPMELDHIPAKDEEFTLKPERAFKLQELGFVVVLDNSTESHGEVVEEVVPDAPTEETKEEVVEEISKEQEALEEESDIKIVKKTKEKGKKDK